MDGTSYQIVGNAVATVNNTTPATLKAVEFTATRTSFTLTAGAMDINASFINPLEVRVKNQLSLLGSHLDIYIAFGSRQAVNAIHILYNERDE